MDFTPIWEHSLILNGFFRSLNFADFRHCHKIGIEISIAIGIASIDDASSIKSWVANDLAATSKRLCTIFDTGPDSDFDTDIYLLKSGKLFKNQVMLSPICIFYVRTEAMHNDDRIF